MKPHSVICSILFFLILAPSPFAAQAQGEWWEMTQKIEMPGMPDLSAMMPAIPPTRVCLTAEPQPQSFKSLEDDQECAVNDVKTSAKATTFNIKCSGDSPLTGHGEMTRTADSLIQKMTLTSEDGDMTITMTGKRIGGACSNP